MMAGRYAHAKQFKRHHRQLRLLRTRLGRIIRDVRRKIAGRPEIEAALEWPLARASQIHSQQQRQRGWKLYSFHAPEVECIGKGKANAPYEFGVRHHQRPRPGRPICAARQSAPGNPNGGSRAWEH
jgi:IS5 family transposase